MNDISKPADKSYKVFISYSWTSTEHENWVIELAQQLVEYGIDVVLDKWNLKKGQDKYHFMEMAVKAPDIDKTLIILEKGYEEKANARTGGVGAETQIISPEIYNSVTQEKFIPIIRERNDKGHIYAPHFLKARVYIDFSDDSKFGEAFNELVHTIIDKPLYKKPKLGKLPAYLFDETEKEIKTKPFLRTIEYILSKNPERLNSTIEDFLETYYDSLLTFKLEFVASDGLSAYKIGEQIVENLNSYKPLRDDFINFFKRILKNGNEIDVDVFVGFFNKLLPLLQHKGSSSYFEGQYDNYKFIIHELFLNLIALLLQHKYYKLVEELLYSKYRFDTGNPYIPSKRLAFGLLYNVTDTFGNYYKTIKHTEYSYPFGNLLLERTPESLSRDMLIDADLLCYIVYIFTIKSIPENFYHERWLPITYLSQNYHALEFFNQLVSKRHFEKVKGIFGVDTPSQLATKIANVKSEGGRTAAHYSDRIPLEQIINSATIALER